MRWTLSLILLAAQLLAQQKKAPTLPQIVMMWSDPVFETTDILNAIDKTNLAFAFDQATLASIIEGARTAKRPPSEVAQLLIRMLRDCRSCRDQFWAPLGPDDLQATLSKGSAYTLDEIRVRGTRTLPVDVAFTKNLAASGATPELIAALEDRIVMPVPDGFKPAKLDKAPDFNPQLNEGKLTMHAEVAGEVVFLFRHNALFFSVIKGEEPLILNAAYNAFGPAKLEPVWNMRITPKLPKGKKLKKGMETATAKTTMPDASGRPGLQLSVNNVDKDRHEYEIELTWTR